MQLWHWLQLRVWWLVESVNSINRVSICFCLSMLTSWRDPSCKGWVLFWNTHSKCTLQHFGRYSRSTFANTKRLKLSQSHRWKLDLMGWQLTVIHNTFSQCRHNSNSSVQWVASHTVHTLLLRGFVSVYHSLKHCTGAYMTLFSWMCKWQQFHSHTHSTWPLWRLA